MNIPIYRAKKIDSDEYVEGYYLEIDDKHIIIKKKASIEICGYYGLGNFGVISQSGKLGTYEIDSTTRSIHFPDMLDNQGNKIFASLSEDGKGGDIMKDDEYYGIAKYKDSRFVVEYENVEECLYEGNFEAIGIQE